MANVILQPPLSFFTVILLSKMFTVLKYKITIIYLQGCKSSLINTDDSTMTLLDGEFWLKIITSWQSVPAIRLF